MRPKRETRFIQTTELRTEYREDDDKSPVIKGYAAVFDEWADIGGWFREKIRKGAFKKTIGEADVRALLNHDANFVLGRNKAGTLRLKEDGHGLAVEIDPPDTQWANDLLVSIKRGDINQMSFGFIPVKEEWNNEENERELTEVRLFDVSAVTYPAYDSTSVGVRSLIELPDMGIDIDAITGILLKSSRGVELSKEDRQKISDHLREIAKSYQPEIEPEPAGHHSDEGEPEIDHSFLWMRDQARITEALTNFSL